MFSHLYESDLFQEEKKSIEFIFLRKNLRRKLSRDFDEIVRHDLVTSLYHCRHLSWIYRNVRLSMVILEDLGEMFSIV